MILSLLTSILFFNFISRFQIEKTGKGINTDAYGLYAQFEKEVIVTQSHITIGPVTFLTRIGGMIGVNKEFYWIIIFCLTNFFTFLKVVKSFFKI